MNDFVTFNIQRHRCLVHRRLFKFRGVFPYYLYEFIQYSNSCGVPTKMFPRYLTFLSYPIQIFCLLARQCLESNIVRSNPDSKAVAMREARCPFYKVLPFCRNLPGHQPFLRTTLSGGSMQTNPYGLQHICLLAWRLLTDLDRHRFRTYSILQDCSIHGYSRKPFCHFEATGWVNWIIVAM